MAAVIIGKGVDVSVLTKVLRKEKNIIQCKVSHIV